MSLQLTRRSFHHLTVCGAALIGSHALWPLAKADEQADVPWVYDEEEECGDGRDPCSSPSVAYGVAC